MNIIVADDTTKQPLGLAKGMTLMIQDLFIPIDAWVLDVKKYDLLLGRPWLRSVNGYTSWVNDKYWISYNGKKATVCKKDPSTRLENRVYSEMFEESDEDLPSFLKDEELSNFIPLDEEGSDIDELSEAALNEEILREYEAVFGEKIENYAVFEEDDADNLSFRESSIELDLPALSNGSPELQNLLEINVDLFGQKGKISQTSMIVHRIDTGNAPAVSCPPYARVSPFMAKKQKEAIDEMLELGIIQPLMI